MYCIVFDIDGTLADGTHRVWLLKSDPKKWDVYFGLLSEDTVIEPVAEICRALANTFQIVYCTGRPEEYIPQTAQWFKDNDLPEGPIFYRKKGDFRDDTIIKLELLEEIKQNGYYPLILFDDRNRVCVALRRAGYTVAQVAEGDY
jgi:phosphatidate phosphatase APP1